MYLPRDSRVFPIIDVFHNHLKVMYSFFLTAGANLTSLLNPHVAAASHSVAAGGSLVRPILAVSSPKQVAV